MELTSFEPDLSAWSAWSPSEVARLLIDVDAPWYVTAGWALDLFHGRQTRDHEDLEIAVPATGFAEIKRALSDYDLYVVGGGLAQALTSETLAEHHQTWVHSGRPASGGSTSCASPGTGTPGSFVEMREFGCRVGA